jgi:hypothetical protein
LLSATAPKQKSGVLFAVSLIVLLQSLIVKGNKPFIFSFLGLICLPKLLSLSPQTAQANPFKLLG